MGSESRAMWKKPWKGRWGKGEVCLDAIREKASGLFVVRTVCWALFHQGMEKVRWGDGVADGWGLGETTACGGGGDPLISTVGHRGWAYSVSSVRNALED